MKTCACFPGMGRGGEIVNGKTCYGDTCRMTTGTTASTTASTSALTLEKLTQAVELVKSLGEEPFAEFIRAQGFDPETHTLYLPMSMKDAVPMAALMPRYVRFTNIFEYPVIVRNPT